MDLIGWILLSILAGMIYLLYSAEKKSKEAKSEGNGVSLKQTPGAGDYVDPWSEGETVMDKLDLKNTVANFYPEGGATIPDGDFENTCGVYTFQKYNSVSKTWQDSRPSYPRLFPGLGTGCWQTDTPSCSLANYTQTCYDADQLSATIMSKNCNQDVGNKCYSKNGDILLSGESEISAFSCLPKCSGVLGFISLDYDTGTEPSLPHVLEIESGDYSTLINGEDSATVSFGILDSNSPLQRFRMIRYQSTENGWVEASNGPFADIIFRYGGNEYFLTKETDNSIVISKKDPTADIDPEWLLVPPSPFTSQIPGLDNQFCTYSDNGVLSFEFGYWNDYEITNPYSAYVVEGYSGNVMEVSLVSNNSGITSQTYKYQPDANDPARDIFLTVTADSGVLTNVVVDNKYGYGYSVGETFPFTGDNGSISNFRVTKINTSGTGFVGIIDLFNKNAMVLTPGSGYTKYNRFRARTGDTKSDGSPVHQREVTSVKFTGANRNKMNQDSKNIVVSNNYVNISTLTKANDVISYITRTYPFINANDTLFCRSIGFPSHTTVPVNPVLGTLGAGEPAYPTKGGDPVSSGSVKLAYMDPYANSVYFPKSYFDNITSVDETPIAFTDEYFIEGYQTIDKNTYRTYGITFANYEKITPLETVTYSLSPQQIVYASDDIKKAVSGASRSSDVWKYLTDYFNSSTSGTHPPKTAKTDVMSIQIPNYKYYSTTKPGIGSEKPVLNQFIPYLNLTTGLTIDSDGIPKAGTKYTNPNYTQFLPWGMSDYFYKLNEDEIASKTF